MGYAETDSDAQAKLAAFRESLYKLGWVEGGNIRMDARWPIPADTKSMQRFAKELVELEPDLILFNSNGGSPGIDSWYFVSRRLRYDPLDMIEHEEVRHDNEAAFGLPCQRCQNSFDFRLTPCARGDRL